jgi:Zn-finger nucleic acid-binding protein
MDQASAAEAAGNAKGTTMTSKNEDEYFAKRDAELKHRMHAQQVADHEAAERRTHLLRCPRCGGRMKDHLLHGITVEQCTECHGVFIDDHALHKFSHHHDAGILGKVFGDLHTALHNKTDAK